MLTRGQKKAEELDEPLRPSLDLSHGHAGRGKRANRCSAGGLGLPVTDAVQLGGVEGPDLGLLAHAQARDEVRWGRGRPWALGGNPCLAWACPGLP